MVYPFLLSQDNPQIPGYPYKPCTSGILKVCYTVLIDLNLWYRYSHYIPKCFYMLFVHVCSLYSLWVSPWRAEPSRRAQAAASEQRARLAASGELVEASWRLESLDVFSIDQCGKPHSIEANLTEKMIYRIRIASLWELPLDHFGSKWWYNDGIWEGLMVEWLDNGIEKPIKDFHLDPFSAQVCSAASWLIELIDNLHWWWWPVVAKLQSKSQFTSGCSLPVSGTYSWKVCFGVFRALSESNCKTALYDRPSLLRGQFSPLRLDLSPIWAWNHITF